jgi:hypothetical protein
VLALVSLHLKYFSFDFHITHTVQDQPQSDLTFVVYEHWQYAAGPNRSCSPTKYTHAFCKLARYTDDQFVTRNKLQLQIAFPVHRGYSVWMFFPAAIMMTRQMCADQKQHPNKSEAPLCVGRRSVVERINAARCKSSPSSSSASPLLRFNSFLSLYDQN